MRLLLFVLGLATSVHVFGQKVYFDKFNSICDEANAVYYELASTENDTVRSYFHPSNILRSVFTRKHGWMEGPATLYHPDGSLRARLTYNLNFPVGLVYSFYPDGKPQSVERHWSIPKKDYMVVNYWDSLGNQIIEEGIGYCRCALEAFENSTIFSVGKLFSGKKDSLWTIYRSGRKYAEEFYMANSLISGTSYDDGGQQYKYSQIEEMAQPQGGMMRFYSHVASVMKYPKGARRMGIEGKVFVEFIVEKDGSLSNVRVIKGIGAGCDEQAVAAVKSSSNWTPALQRGQKVRQKMVLPVQFKLG